MRYGQKSKTKYFVVFSRQHVARICYEHDINDICQSVTLVDCEHIVQQKLKIRT